MALTETTQFDPSDRIASLSQREMDFLGHVHAGLTSKQIAQHERVSEHTVNDYIKSAVRKLGAGDRREAARILTESTQRPKDLEASVMAQVSAKELARLLRTGGKRRFIELNGPDLNGVERLAAIAVIVIVSLVFVSLVFALVGFSFRELGRVAGHPAAGVEKTDLTFGRESGSPAQTPPATSPRP